MRPSTQTVRRQTTSAGKTFLVAVLGSILFAGQTVQGETPGPQPEPSTPQTGECPGDDATIALYDGFDLEQGEIHDPLPFYPEEVDFHLAYNADWDAAVLFQENGAWISFLNDTPFEDVDLSDLAKAAFTQFLIDEPLDYEDTVVLYTADGNYFKIGNAEMNADYTVTFDFQQLCLPKGLLSPHGGRQPNDNADEQDNIAK